MNIERVFKNLILIDVLVIFLLFSYGIIVGVNAESSMGTLSENQDAASWIVVVLGGLYIGNLYLLYKFRPIGKSLYVPLFILLLAMTFAAPDEMVTITSAVEIVLEVVSGSISGMIIAMLYWTDIKNKFER